MVARVRVRARVAVGLHAFIARAVKEYERGTNGETDGGRVAALQAQDSRRALNLLSLVTPALAELYVRG